MAKLVYGVGDKGTKYSCRDGNTLSKEYNAWRSLLYRCNPKYWENLSCYAGVTCTDNFKSFTFFYEWCQQQKGFGNIDDNGKSWHLDKDILVKGNKVYSEDTCVFVPQKINSLVIVKASKRGEYPLGVSLNKISNKYVAHCNNGTGVKKYLGWFDTQEEAFICYKTYKESVVKKAAERYRDDIDERLYQALLDYRVEITD